MSPGDVSSELIPPVIGLLHLFSSNESKKKIYIIMCRYTIIMNEIQSMDMCIVYVQYIYIFSE